MIAVDRVPGTVPAGEPVDRRRFLEFLASAGAGVVVLVLLGEKTVLADKIAPPAGAAPQPEYDWTKHLYVYVVDTRKCIGCGSCVRACQRENKVPEKYFRTWVERYMISRTGQTTIDSPAGAARGFAPQVLDHDVAKAYFVPKLCNHCTFTPCVQLCPVGASYRTEDGVILVDEERCIGCGYCVQACPYGSRFLNPETHTASKCTLCYHRITKGLQPACVQACPVGARMLGNARDPYDQVAALMSTERVGLLKPELLTGPNCYYLGLDKGVR
jgi:Fe-S-cluster-containing dehydrogenase component